MLLTIVFPSLLFCAATFCAFGVLLLLLLLFGVELLRGFTFFRPFILLLAFFGLLDLNLFSFFFGVPSLPLPSSEISSLTDFLGVPGVLIVLVTVLCRLRVGCGVTFGVAGLLSVEISLVTFDLPLVFLVRPDFPGVFFGVIVGFLFGAASDFSFEDFNCVRTTSPTLAELTSGGPFFSVSGDVGVSVGVFSSAEVLLLGISCFDVTPSAVAVVLVLSGIAVVYSKNINKFRVYQYIFSGSLEEYR